MEKDFCPEGLLYEENCICEGMPVTQDGFYGLAVYLTVTDTGRPLPGRETAVLRPVRQQVGDYLAIVNHSASWCRPFFSNDLRQLPENTQLLLFRAGEGYACLLPVCDSLAKTVLRGGEEGLRICLSTNKSGLVTLPRQLSYLYMEGEDPHALLHAAAKCVSDLLGQGLLMREEREYPPVFEKIGWCSWDSFHIHVTHAGLLEKAAEFREKGVPIGYAIIDDMWADVPILLTVPEDAAFNDMTRTMYQGKLRRFEGDPVRFPHGMAAAVRDLKAAGIPQVGIWFPTTGYWRGWDPTGEAATFAADMMQDKDGRYIPRPEREAAASYFDRLCAKCRTFGADFVKIDRQGMHHFYEDTATFGESSTAIGHGIEAAVARHFSGAVINCMGMPSECMFHRINSAVCRTSDDFMPEDGAWFCKNILQCAYNGLLQGQYQVNDFDMFWTDDAQARKNSLLRALSGGPIYLSDKVGRTRKEILAPLILSDGRILRCDESATPAPDCLLTDPTQGGRIFKIRNRVRDCGLLGVFHIADSVCATGHVGPRDCGLADGRYAYFEYFTRAAGILSEGESIPVTLSGPDDLRLFTFLPMVGEIAALGRSDLFIGVRAATFDGARLTVMEGGEISFISEKEIRACDENGHPLPTVRRGLLHTVVTEKQVRVLDIG